MSVRAGHEQHDATSTAGDPTQERGAAVEAPAASLGPALSRGPSPALLLAMQASAGNQATRAFLAREPAAVRPPFQRVAGGVLQRDLLDDAVAGVAGMASAGAAAVGELADDALAGGAAVVRALTFAGELAANPQRITALIAEVSWTDLPDAVKAQVIDAVLGAASYLVRNSPLPDLPMPFLWRMLRSAMAGFVEQVRIGYTDDQKIAIANRLVGLWATPSADFSMGFLRGFALGLWDGVSGPFELLWDLMKLQVKITELQLRFISGLADDDRRRELFNGLQAAVNRVAPAVEEAWNDMVSGKSDPLALFNMIDDFLEGILNSAEGLGARMADALMNYLKTATDRDLGHALGRIEGNITFEVVLFALTSGGYTAVKEALSGIRWVAQLLERLNEMRQALRAAEVVEMFATQFGRLVTFVRNSRVLSSIADGLGEVLQLLAKYLRLSYGVEGGVDEGAAAIERGAGLGQDARRGARAAEGLEEGVRFARQLPNGGTLKYLETGVFVICHSPCVFLEGRYARELQQLGREADLAAIKGRMDAAATSGNAAAEEAAFDEAIKLEGELRQAHRQYLGTDVADAGGRFRRFEADAAEHIEQGVGRPLERLDPANNPNHVNRSGDWFDPIGRNTYDAVGPAPRYDFGEFSNSIREHSVKTGLDFMFIDLSMFTPTQQREIINFMNTAEMLPFLTGARKPKAQIFISPARGIL
jgi:hypothetical protein